MQIRLARSGDLQECLALDCSYQTEYVWQVETHAEPERVEAVFQRTRLPRPVTVNVPPDARSLRLDWERQECFLVADHLGRVTGYLNMTLREAQNAGWVNGVAVDREFRRHGIGKALVRSARLWAEQQNLRVVIVEARPKNYPLIQLCQQAGFRFCGYNEQHYASDDIALLFANRIR